MYKQNKL